LEKKNKIDYKKMKRFGRKPVLPVTTSYKSENSPKIDSRPRCKYCKKYYNPDENNEYACSYHPGPIKCDLRVRNYHDEITYECCNKKEIGFSERLTKTEGCIISSHVPLDEKN
tara:strand:- start:65 stop:403 length:339 start_codon:yes stop_codon:yes gene_type:complete